MPDVITGPGPRLGKGAARTRKAALGPPITWPNVVVAVQSDDARSCTMGWYNSSGYCPDDFARKAAARAVMVEALTRTEDLLEAKGRTATPERLRISEIRRRLELELYP